MKLADLDDRFVPRAAARLRGWVDAAERRRASAVRLRDELRPELLDERFTHMVLVHRLRQQPALAGLAALIMLVAGLGAATVVGRNADEPTVVPVGVDVGERPGPGSLGPRPGQATDAYERASTQGLVTAVQRDPAGALVALVSLAEYRTPDEAVALMAGFDVDRVFLRAPGAGPEAPAFPVDVKGSLRASLDKAYSDTARNRAAASTQYQAYVDRLAGSSEENRKYRPVYEAAARTSRLESQEFGRGCACVLGALVTASPAQLLTLRARPGVRAVEVAEAGLTAALVQVQPLLPEVVGVVPRRGGKP